MKSCLLLWVLGMVTTLPVLSQTSFEKQQKDRDSLIRVYHSHRDTVTINTWLNIRKSNQYLEQIKQNDSILIALLLQEIGNLDYTLENDNIRLMRFRKELDSLYKLTEKPTTSRRLIPKEYNFGYFIGGFIPGLILLLISLKLFANRLRKREIILKQYHTELYSARQELEAMEKTHLELASEVNKLKRELSRVEDNKALLQKLEDEKVLLEHQILEIQKAFLTESEKRKEAQSKLVSIENEKNSEIQNLKSDILLLKEGISIAESFQNKLVNEFNSLIKRIKNRF